MSNNIWYTREGLAKLQKDYTDLLSQRPEAVKELTRAREMGDLSENGFYKGARSKLSQIDSRLRHLKHLLKHAAVKQQTINGIDIGTTVRLHDGTKEQAFTIVGEFESNPLEGKLSHKSPLGTLLMGKNKGDIVKVHTSRGETIYTIEEVQR